MRRKFWASTALFVILMLLVSACSGTKKEEPKSTDPNLKTLSFELMAYSNPRPYNPEGDKLAEAIQAELKKAGIDVKITTLQWTPYKDAVRKDGKGDAYLFGWIGDNGDPDNFLFVHFHSSQSGLNIGKYKNDKVDDLLLKAQQVSDMKQRSQFYADAQTLIAQDAPWVFLSHMNDFVAARSTVKNFKIHPTLTLYDFNKIEVDGKKNLVYARGADATSLDPAVVEDGESAKVISQIYDNLVRFKDGSTEIQPSLAEKWDISADGKTYTFSLKKGVKFSDGTDFNADAVKFSIDRQLTDDARKNWPYADFSFGMVKETKVVDTNTIQVILNQPMSPFLANLAMSIAAPIVSPTAVKKWGKDYGEHPVGTGAFTLEKWDKGQQIVLKANPNYWGGAPKLEQVIFKVTDKNEVRADEIIAGKVDIMDGVAISDLDRLKKAAPGVTMLTQPGMNISYMSFRTDRAPFNNPKVRQAISMLIDRDAILKALYKGNATLANGALPSWMPGYAPSVKPLAYDVAKAKALLKEAGYSTTK